MPKKFLIKGSDLLLTNGDDKFLYVSKPGMAYVSGGTDITLTQYPISTEATYDQELVDADLMRRAEWAGSSVMNINGSAVGSITLDVSQTATEDNDEVVIFSKSGNTWNKLFEDEVPSTKLVSIALDQFGPLAIYKKVKVVIPWIDPIKTDNELLVQQVYDIIHEGTSIKLI